MVISLDAQARVTFTGSGAGHGVGMSQYGAQGRALAGQSAAQILAAYYVGTTLTASANDATPIRILLPSGAVRTLPLRDYLGSVVSSELPPGFPPAALQAQAIASRTFALWERDARRPYDVTSTVSTQVFGATPRPEATTAVAATSGQVLTYNGALIPAYFHACSAAMTENNADVWPGPPLPYLQAIDDRDASGVPYAKRCPHLTWQAGPFTAGQLTAILSASDRTNVGLVMALNFAPRSAAERWTAVTIVGAAGSKTVSLTDFRAAMDARAAPGDIIYSADFAATPIAGPPPALSFVL